MTFLKSLPDDVRILLILGAFWIPVMLITGVFAYRDARRFGKQPLLWGLVSAFGPFLMGFIAYVTTRNMDGQEREDATPTARVLRNVLVSILVIPALLAATIAGVMNFTEGNNLFLTRYDTDLTLTDDLIDPEYLRTENWRSITRTNADGSTAEVQQFFGNFRITHTTPEGASETAVYDFAYGGVMKGPNGRYANLEGDSFTEYMSASLHRPFSAGSGYYFYNEAEQIFLLQIKSDREPEQEHCVSLFYDETGRVTKQQYESEYYDDFRTLLELTPEEANLRYDCYTYDPQGRILRSDRHDYEDRLVSTTKYLWRMDGSLRIAQTCTPTGELTATSVSTFDTAGRLAKQDYFDGAGNWLYSVEFCNGLTAFLLLDATTIMLGFLWAVVMLITVLMLLPEKRKT